MDADAVIAEALREVPAKKPKVRPILRKQYAHDKQRRPLPVIGRWPWPNTSSYGPFQGFREMERRRRQMAKQKA